MKAGDTPAFFIKRLAMEWLDLTLTLEQKFLLKRAECEAGEMKREELEKSLLSVMQLLMVKDNVVKQMLLREVRGKMP